MKKLLTLSLCAIFILSANAFAQEDAPPEDGTHKTYYESGALESKKKYKDGQLHGVAKYYYESGQLAIESRFENGLIDGTEKKYHENGRLQSVATFEDGLMQGTLKLYDKEGNLTNEIAVKDDNREGIAKEFRADESLKEQCVYQKDEVITCEYFDEEGNLSAKSQIDPENPDRTIYLTYDKEGNVIEAQQTIDE